MQALFHAVAMHVGFFEYLLKTNNNLFVHPEQLYKELKGTTGRRIVRGILGGLFKGR